MPRGATNLQSAQRRYLSHKREVHYVTKKCNARCAASGNRRRVAQPVVTASTRSMLTLNALLRNKRVQTRNNELGHEAFLQTIMNDRKRNVHVTGNIKDRTCAQARTYQDKTLQSKERRGAASLN